MRNSKAIGVLVNIAIYLIAFAIGFIPYFFMLQANTHPILNMLVLTCTATLVMYIFCVVFKNTSIYDPYWSVAPFIMVIIHMVAYRLYNINSIIFAVLVFFYTVRLTRNWYLTYNGLDPKNEDWRYQKYRNSLSKWKFEIVNSIGLIFMPTLVVYACLIPGLLFMFVEAFAPLALIGFFFMLVGPFLELISDYQVHKFIKDNDDHSLVCDIGLWNYSRHPNYLGELTFWFGIMLVFLLTRYDIWYFGLGFIFMFSLFMFISIPLMEKHNIEKRPAYLEYKKHTSKLFILPRKK